MRPGSWEGASLGVISPSRGIGLTKAYFPPAPRGVRTCSLLLAPARRIHLRPGCQIPEDYYTEASRATEALISLTGPKQVHLLRQRGHRRWPTFKALRAGPGRVTRGAACARGSNGSGRRRSPGSSRGVPGQQPPGSPVLVMPRGAGDTAASGYVQPRVGVFMRRVLGKGKMRGEGFRESIVARTRVILAKELSRPSVGMPLGCPQSNVPLPAGHQAPWLSPV